MIIVVRPGVLVRWIVCAAAITTVLVAGAVRQADPVPPPDEPAQVAAADR